MGWDEKKILSYRVFIGFGDHLFGHFCKSYLESYIIGQWGKSFNEYCSWWLQWKIKKIKIICKTKQLCFWIVLDGWLVQILFSELGRSHFRCILAVCFFKWHKWRTYKYTYTRIVRDSSEIRGFLLDENDPSKCFKICYTFGIWTNRIFSLKMWQIIGSFHDRSVIKLFLKSVNR